jgi:surfeit locus 1 family protein
MELRKFRFELGPTLVVLALVPALLALGRWQLARADEKRALLAGYAAASAAPAVDYAATLPRFTRVRVAGRWDPRQFLLDAQVQQGQVGYRILTPLVLGDGSRLIVDRGWVAADADRATLPEVAIAPTDVALEGLLDGFAEPGVRTGAAADAATGWPRVELYPTAEALGAALGARVQPLLLRLGGDVSYADAIGFPPERHLGYAVTWFALAATLVVLWLAHAARSRDGERV